MISRRQAAALTVAILVLGPTVGPALAAVQTVFVSSGTPVGTQSGLVIKPGNDGQYNLEDPWQSSNELQLRNVTFEGRNTTATVDNFGDPANGGEWTNASQINTDSDGRIIINRSDARGIGATGGVDQLRVHSSDMSENTDNVDIVASASTDWGIIVNDTGLSQGTGLVAEDAETGEALGSGVVDNNGNVKIEGVSSVTDAKINLRVGPSELRVFEEASPNELVDGTELRVRAFGSDDVVEREVTDGTMSLAGIPSDEQLTITVDEEEHYAYRRITIPSVTQQQEVYLLNTTENNDLATVQFNIDDKTGGDFSTATTEFIVEKAVKKDFDGDGEDEARYQAISGDTIGSSGEYTATLENDERYRLKVRNGNGDVRMLGSYTVQGSAAPTVTIGDVTINADTSEGYAVSTFTFLNDTDDDGTQEQFVRVEYVDEDDRTEEFRYELVNESSGQTIDDTATTGELGTYSATYRVADSEVNGITYRLDWETTRTTENGSSTTDSGTEYAGDIPTIGGKLPIDDKWLSLIALVSIVAVAGLVVIYDGALAALVATGWSSLLTILGIVAIPMPALGLAGAVSVVALVGRVR